MKLEMECPLGKYKKKTCPGTETCNNYSPETKCCWYPKVVCMVDGREEIRDPVDEVTYNTTTKAKVLT
jgi:hypothetical protein